MKVYFFRKKISILLFSRIPDIRQIVCQISGDRISGQISIRYNSRGVLKYLDQFDPDLGTNNDTEPPDTELLKKKHVYKVDRLYIYNIYTIYILHINIYIHITYIY